MPPATAKSPIGQPFVELPVVDSTNIYAMDRLQANMAAHGTAYFAWDQQAGKGQYGRQWNTEPGSNIILSVIMDTSFLLLTEQFTLSMTVALACHDFFSSYAGEETKIKWPNDLYWRDRKAGGILIENAVKGADWQAAVAGIGININQVLFPEQVMQAVSLKQITGKDFEVVTLARELCSALQKRYGQLQDKDVNTLLASYNNFLFKKGEEIKLRKDNRVFSCTILGVNAQGELLVSGASQDLFRFGEVGWVI